ncbi:hypothetical protein ACTU3I_03500 [Microbacterium sp. RD1]|uniref:hypothetical protein n=1 Tax=Microbacterium sp. RD1 TaxID=3457313 RepID=UPI003FA545AE
MSQGRTPRKRPAFEPPVALIRPIETDPAMRRPASTIAGAALVLLRAIAGAVWLLGFGLGWSGWVRDFAAAFSGDATDSAVPPTTSATIVTVVLLFVGGGALIEAVLGILILRGANAARVVVMVISTISIVTAFVGWWVHGQEIRIQTTYVTLALDILILLALSSRASAAYARRRERRS